MNEARRTRLKPSTMDERFDWLASMLRDECNCLQGRLNHDNCLHILSYRHSQGGVTGPELKSLMLDGLEEESLV